MKAPASSDEGLADESDVIAVVDTNVLLDIYSCHDLTETYDRLGERSSDDRSGVYRRARIRESLLLAMYFHAKNATTISLNHEPLAQMLKKVPPSNRGAFETNFAVIFLELVRPRLIPGWKVGMHTDPVEVAGNDADQWLLDYAQRCGLPLITNEGYKDTGIIACKLRKRAIDAGVQVFTPREFWNGKLDEQLEIERFLARLSFEAPLYVEKHPKADQIRESVAYAEGYFRHVLLGKTQGRAENVRVRLD